MVIEHRFSALGAEGPARLASLRRKSCCAFPVYASSVSWGVARACLLQVDTARKRTGVEGSKHFEYWGMIVACFFQVSYPVGCGLAGGHWHKVSSLSLHDKRSCGAVASSSQAGLERRHCIWWTKLLGDRKSTFSSKPFQRCTSKVVKHCFV